MANENDIVSRILLDDSDFIKKMEGTYPIMDKYEARFDSLQKEVKETTQAIGKDLVDANTKAAKSIENVTKATINDSKALEKQKKDIADVSLQIAKNSSESEKLMNVYKKLMDAKAKGILLDAQDVNELSDGFAKFAKDVGLSEKGLTVLTQNLEEVVSNIKAVNSDEFKELATKSEQVTEKFKSAKSELRELSNLINSGQLTGDELVQARQRAAELTDTIGDTAEQIKNLSSDTKGLDTLIEGTRLVAAGFAIAEGATALFGEENKDVQEALVKLNAVMALSNGLQEAHALLLQNSNLRMRAAAISQGIFATVVGTSTGALKLFRVALALTGVGLLVIGLGALIANFDKVKEKITNLFPSLKNLGETFKGLKDTFYGVLDGIVAGFGVIGEVIGNIFKGDFPEAIASAKKFGEVVGNAIVEGTKKSAQETLDKELAGQIDQTVKQQKKRLDILQAGGKETANVQRKILQNELKSLQLAGADKQVIEDKQHEIAVFNAARTKQLADEAEKEKQKKIDAEKKATDSLRQIRNQLFDLQKETNLLSKEEQFNIIKAKNIEALKGFKAELERVSKVLGIDLSEDITKFQFLIDKLDASKFIGEIEKIGQIPLPEKLFSNFEKSAEQSAKEIGAKMKISIPKPETEDFFEGIEDFEDLLQKSLDKIFGPEGGEQAREFLSGLSSLVGEFGNILNEATDLQIEAIDKQLDSLSERREKAQEELDKELEFQKEGLANNVGNKEDEVNGLLAEESRLTAERERIQKEAQRRQLIAETAQQTQGLITSAINIYKGFSVLGPIGIPLAIAAIGAMFGFFAKTKADAFKATRLYTGANRIDDHFGEVGSRSDIPGRGEGYRVIDAVTGQDTNVRISGREMLLPEDITQSQSRFFKNLKAGRYNFDIAEALDLHSSLGRSVKEKGVHNTIINNTALQPSKQWVSYTNRKGEVKAVLLDIPTNGDKQTYVFKD
jgi:hypothetical protein